VFTNAGIALIDALHDGREATVHELVDETGLSASQIYRTADELHTAGLTAESRAHHNQRILRVTGHPVIEAYRNLVSKLGHVDWPDLLSPATIRICWLLDSRPRDAHNVFDLQVHGDRVAFAPQCWFGRPSNTHKSKRSVSWYVQCYLHAGAGDDGVIPVGEDALDGLQVGGARNYGFGELSLVDTQVVDLDALDFPRLEAAQGDGAACRLELVTPYVLDTEHPSGDAQDIPWWWRVDTDGTPPSSVNRLRRRETRLVDGSESHAVRTVDHGQVVQYAGDEPVATARNGVLRVGTHSRFGFGEVRVRPPGEDRVPERRAARAGGEV
jgi:hypothetical protein